MQKKPARTRANLIRHIVALDPVVLRAKESMNPELRKVAKTCLRLCEWIARGNLVLHYELGEWIGQAESKPRSYGPDAVKLLSRFLAISERDLHDLRVLAREFPAWGIDHFARSRMANGGRVGLQHILILSRMKKDAVQLGASSRMYEESLSPLQLKRAITTEIAVTRRRGRQRLNGK